MNDQPLVNSISRTRCNVQSSGHATLQHRAFWISGHIHGRPHIGTNGVSCPPPWKNRWKIKKRKHAKKSSFLDGGGRWSDTSDDWLVKLMIIITVIIIDHYHSSRVSLFKFSKCSSPRAARGHRPPNQNPADALGYIIVRNHESRAKLRTRIKRCRLLPHYDISSWAEESVSNYPQP